MRARGFPAWAPWFFLAPFLILFSLFTIYPLWKSVVLAFEQTYGPDTVAWVGLDNFKFLFSDPLFWTAVRNTAIFAAASVLIQLPLSLSLALLLNQPALRGRGVFRLIFFSPALFGVVFVAMLFSLVFEKYTGLLNVALHALFGFNIAFPWMEEYTLAALIIAALWMYTGFNMIYFLAALQGVNQDLIDAARIDGADWWRRFLHVTLPQIRPVASFVVLLSLIGSFQLFELPWILLNGGPGADNKGLTIVMYLYMTGFESGDLGYASAIGWVLALALIVFAAGQRWISKNSET